MVEILACVDESDYASSVCDHAAWFAGRLETGVQVLHAVETGEEVNLKAQVIVQRSLDLLKNEGCDDCHGQALCGTLAKLAAAATAPMVVMGKRGGNGESEGRRLGSHVSSMLAAVAAPLCLASKLFLPIRRALALLDADMSHRSAVEFVSSHPGLRDLDIDFIVAASHGEDTATKIAWARKALSARQAAVFNVTAESLLSAVEGYTKSRTCDLIIVSRAVLSAKASDDIAKFEAREIWSWRTPILIC